LFIYDGFESTENTLRNEIKGTEYIGYVPSEYIFVLRYFHIFVFKSCILFSQLKLKLKFQIYKVVDKLVSLCHIIATFNYILPSIT
jgi:hypothetical protein